VVRRISENALKDLVKGPVRTLAVKPQDQKNPKIDACNACLSGTYYDVDFQARINKLTWQAMLLLN
jgi:hypothetical protein